MGEARARVIRGVALATGATLAWLEWQASPNADRTVLAFDVAVGLTFFVAAVITLGVPTARRIAYLELAAGVAWFVGALTPVASGAYLGFLVHLLVTYPTGRLERPVQRARRRDGLCGRVDRAPARLRRSRSVPSCAPLP